MILILRCDPNLQFTRVSGKGSFLDTEFLVGPRTLPAESDQGGGSLMTTAKRIGYLVYSPFKLVDGRVIMVNRGWIPREWSDKRQDRNNVCNLIHKLG
jgi:cytochrome oxidase assembly protein ShyY1